MLDPTCCALLCSAVPEIPPVAETPHRRGLVGRFRLLTRKVLLDRSGSGSGILSLNLPGWCGIFDPTPSLDLPKHFQGVTILGLQRVCTDKICPNFLARGYNMRERGKTGEHATKVTDVWRKRVVAWWGQYEWLEACRNELGLDLCSREKEKKMLQQNLGSSEADSPGDSFLPQRIRDGLTHIEVL